MNKEILKVSVLIAVYNEELYLESCLQSISALNYPSVEVVVVDDYSTDNTFQIAQEFSRASQVEVIVSRSKKKGKASAFNQAFELSSGDVVTLLGGDDTVTDKYISDRVSYFKDPHQAIVVMGKYLTMSNDPKFDGVLAPISWDNNRNFSGGLMMMSRCLANKAFPVPESLPSEDGWIGLHARFQSSVIYVDSTILNYRIHGGNSVNRRATFIEASERISSRRNAELKFFDKYKDILSQENLRELKNDIKVEELRREGRVLSLLFMQSVSLSVRSRALSHAHPIAYWLRFKFFRLFSGL